MKCQLFFLGKIRKYFTTSSAIFLPSMLNVNYQLPLLQESKFLTKPMHLVINLYTEHRVRGGLFYV